MVNCGQGQIQVMWVIQGGESIKKKNSKQEYKIWDENQMTNLEGNKYHKYNPTVKNYIAYFY